MFIDVQVFDDYDRILRPCWIRKENVQAVGDKIVLPSLRQPDGIPCHKVRLLGGVWFWVSTNDVAKLIAE
jgi:hypothetical protein